MPLRPLARIATLTDHRPRRCCPASPGSRSRSVHTVLCTEACDVSGVSPFHARCRSWARNLLLAYLHAVNLGQGMDMGLQLIGLLDALNRLLRLG